MLECIELFGAVAGREHALAGHQCLLVLDDVKFVSKPCVLGTDPLTPLSLDHGLLKLSLHLPDHLAFPAYGPLLLIHSLLELFLRLRNIAECGSFLLQFFIAAPQAFL